MGDIGDMMITEAVTESGTVTETVTEGAPPIFVFPDWWWDFWDNYYKSTAKRDEFLEEWADFFGICASVLCCVSVVTNGLCILTFATKKSKKEQTVNTLLIALAVADSLSLVNAWDAAVVYWTGSGLMGTTQTGCKLIPYIGNIARDCSYYITLGFTVDRFVSVTVPLKKALWINKARVRAYLIAIVVIFAAMEAYVPYHLDYYTNFYKDGKEVCLAENGNRFQSCVTYVQNTVGFLLPAAIVFALNILILRQLAKWASQRQSMTGKEGGKGGQGTNRALTVLLLVISTWSFAVSVPKTAFYIIYTYEDTDLGTESGRRAYKAQYISDAVRLLNFSCNFFFYCLSGSQFRDDLMRALYRVFCCRGEYKQTRLHFAFADCYYRMHRKLTNYGRVRSLKANARPALNLASNIGEVYDQLKEALTEFQSYIH